MKQNKFSLKQRTMGLVALVSLAMAPALHASINAELQTSISQLSVAQPLVQQSVLKLLGQTSVAQPSLNQLSRAQPSFVQQCLGDMIGQPGLSQLSLANQDQQVLKLLPGSASAQDNAAQLSLAQNNLSQPSSQLSTGLKINQGGDKVASLLQQTIQQGLSGNMVNGTKCMVIVLDPQKLVQQQTTLQQSLFLLNSSASRLQVAQNSLSTGLPIAQNNNNVWDGIASAQLNQLSTGLRINSGLDAGDFGNQKGWQGLKNGSKLDFFMFADRANEAWATSLQSASNPDGLAHQLAGWSGLNSPFTFLAFENLWGSGDREINARIAAINIGRIMVCAILATPEPAMPLTFAAFLAVALFAARKNKKAVTTA